VRPVAVIGNLARDLVDGQPPRIGGCPFYAARALRALGRPGRIVTRCADEDAKALLPDLLALGVPVTRLPAHATSTFGIRYEGETRLMRVETAGDPWTVEDARGPVAEAVNAIEWMHIGPLLRTDFPAETLAELARRHRLTLDGQGLVRAADIGPLKLDADFDPEILRHLTGLKLAEEEAHAIVGEIDERSIAALGVPEVLVTLGIRGSIVFTRGGSTHVPAHPVHDVDPTGAGDAYMTAYIASRSSGHTPVSAARVATSLVASLLAAQR
jgi:sugar/nucleoside kinase (ribokinase family)